MKYKICLRDTKSPRNLKKVFALFLESLFVLVSISDLLSTEMEVTKIILVWKSRDIVSCRVTNVGFFQIFKSMGLSFGFLSASWGGGGVETLPTRRAEGQVGGRYTETHCNNMLHLVTCMLSKDVFDIDTLNIWTNQNEPLMKKTQNTKNPDENPDLPMDFKNLKKPNRSLKTFVDCLWFPKRKLGLWKDGETMDLEIYGKSVA
jgi:hypothetical protein